VVPRRAPNLKDLLFKRKALALDPEWEHGTVKCHADGCQTCSLVSNTVFLDSENGRIKTAGAIASHAMLYMGFNANFATLGMWGKLLNP